MTLHFSPCFVRYDFLGLSNVTKEYLEFKSVLCKVWLLGTVTCYKGIYLEFSPCFVRSDFLGLAAVTKEYLSYNVTSKPYLCEGGSLSPTILNSEIELSVFSISYFISVCPFVAMSKAMYAENSHIVFCLVDITKRLFLTSCVFWFIQIFVVLLTGFAGLELGSCMDYEVESEAVPNWATPSPRKQKDEEQKRPEGYINGKSDNGMCERTRAQEEEGN